MQVFMEGYFSTLPEPISLSNPFESDYKSDLSRNFTSKEKRKFWRQSF